MSNVLHALIRPVEGTAFGLIARSRWAPAETAEADLAGPLWASGVIVELPAGTPTRGRYVPDMAEPAALADRPALAVSVGPIIAGSDLALVDLPEGTAWEIWDVTAPGLPPALSAEGMVGPDGALTELMEDAGTYELRLSPPFPWLRFVQRFEVSDGA